MKLAKIKMGDREIYRIKTDRVKAKLIVYSVIIGMLLLHFVTKILTV